jgi:hypothetical protein
MASPYTLMHADSNARRRKLAVEEAKARMAALGVKWGVVRDWCLEHGWKLADVASLSPLAVEAYWKAHGEPPVEAAS